MNTSRSLFLRLRNLFHKSQLDSPAFKAATLDPVIALRYD